MGVIRYNKMKWSGVQQISLIMVHILVMKLGKAQTCVG